MNMRPMPARQLKRGLSGTYIPIEFIIGLLNLQ